MLEQLEALITLGDCGTMQRTASALHVTQSAVSKRIAELQRQLGIVLVKPEGRGVRLTPGALSLIERLRPILFEFKSALLGATPSFGDKITVDVAASVLLPWGARALAQAKAKIQGLSLEVQTHHASVAVERVRTAESMVAIAQGNQSFAPDLQWLPLFEQELVLVPSGLKQFSWPKRGSVPVLAIERFTEAWKLTEATIQANKEKWHWEITVQQEVQSFSAIAQLARYGFGHGIVPEQVALTLGIPRQKIVRFPKRALSIPVAFVARASTLGKPLVLQLYENLRNQK